MFPFFRLWFGLLARCFRSHRTLLLENLALRQQLAVLKRRHPRARLRPIDKLFWVLARWFWADWKKWLLVVTPETVVRWHRAGFRLYWSLLSKVKKQVGRKRLSKEVRHLIFRMVAENPTWGAPRIHRELLMLGLDVSERSISRWMKQAPRDPELARRGWPLFEIIATPSLPWISSQSQRSPSSCCTASLLLATIGGKFCTAGEHWFPWLEWVHLPELAYAEYEIWEIMREEDREIEELREHWECK